MEPETLEQQVHRVIEIAYKEKFGEKDPETLEKLKKVMKWTVIEGVVYDITNYIDNHPGGKKILRGIGEESSEMFERYHPGLQIAASPLVNMSVGRLDGKPVTFEPIKKVQHTKPEDMPKIAGISIEAIESSDEDEKPKMNFLQLPTKGGMLSQPGGLGMPSKKLI